jgi:hypothetical protein
MQGPVVVLSSDEADMPNPCLLLWKMLRGMATSMTCSAGVIGIPDEQLRSNCKAQSALAAGCRITTDRSHGLRGFPVPRCAGRSWRWCDHNLLPMPNIAEVKLHPQANKLVKNA